MQTVVMGRNVFTCIADALKPMQSILTSAVRRRSDIWQHLPAAHGLLAQEPLATFLEPPRTLLNVDLPFEKAVSLFGQAEETIFFVVNDQQQYVGLLTRTDLLHVLEIAAATGESESVKVKDVMATELVAISTRDTAEVAISTMRERGLKKLPVVSDDAGRRLVGFSRIERLMDFLIERMRADSPADVS